jgi:hypothetical protein
LFSFKNFSPCSSCADISVQVIFPGSQYQTNEQEQPKHVSSAVDSTNPVGSASSAAPPDSASLANLAEKAISALPLDLAAQAVDVKRKARSQDPGWKFGWWPYPAKKDFVQCIFCMKVILAGNSRFKQHLSGEFGYTTKCARVPGLVSKEMMAYLNKNSKVVVNVEAAEEIQISENPYPSSGTKYKQAKKKATQAAMTSFVVSAPIRPTTQKQSKSVSGMLSKTPEEVVAERHKGKASQSTLEHCTKKGKEAKQIVDDHVADFLYENKIPLHVVNSGSWEITLESIGQYEPGYRGPSYHKVRVPGLERVVTRTSELRKKHELAWKEYGCSLMSDGWTDMRQRHLINFLVNSPAGTYFLTSVDASSEIASATMLADLLEKQIEKIGKENVWAAVDEALGATHGL